MHDLTTIQRMNREAVENYEATEQAEATHKVCGKPVTFNRADISEGDTESFPTGQYGSYYAAACLYCDEDLMEFEIEYPQPTQDERSAAMQRHPAGKARAATTKPLKPAEAAHLASASAHELARKVLMGFTKNGEIPFALSGQAAADIIAVAIEADRAKSRRSALECTRLLNDLDEDGEGRENVNKEYLRGQVELIADMFGDGHGEYTDAKYGICDELGVEEL